MVDINVYFTFMQMYILLHFDSFFHENASDSFSLFLILTLLQNKDYSHLKISLLFYRMSLKFCKIPIISTLSMVAPSRIGFLSMTRS